MRSVRGKLIVFWELLPAETLSSLLHLGKS
jgi:hypothetical protein